MAKNQLNLVFYHAPWSRSAGVRWLLEELGVDYTVRFVNVHVPTGAEESYRAIQAHKKVPAIQHGSLIVTERAAISIYLADTFPEAGLAPRITDADRGSYLTSLVYSDSVFDPCIAMRAKNIDYNGRDFSFGAFDDMINNIERSLQRQPFAAGARFTAADIQLASGLAFTMQVLRVVPERPAFVDYLGRVLGRPANQRAAELDAALIAEHPEAYAHLGVVDAGASA
jgi:glutathione S-transferase